MKKTKMIVSLLLTLLMLFGATACQGDTPSVTDTHTETVTEAENESDVERTDTEKYVDESVSDTEALTEIEEPDFSVYEQEGAAKVMTKDGFEFTAKNYSAMEDGTFTVNQGFEVTFPENCYVGEFNRVSFDYTSSEPMKVYICYTLDGETAEDYFFIEETKKSFSGLITSYLDGKCGAKLERMIFNTCREIDAQLTLYNVSTEVIPLYDDDLTVENHRFKIGVRLSWGGAMTYYEDKNDGIAGLGNLVNIHDTGRLIQQSFYGTKGNDEYIPGTYTGGTSWPYNPVQGGNKFQSGRPHLINVEVGEDYIYVLAQSLDWALDNVLTYTYYENKYTVCDDYVLVDNVATDFSGWEHSQGGQEIPAVYLVSYFDTLCYYNGTKPWTGDAEALCYVRDLGGWSESGNYYFVKGNTETWATWINTADNFAIGIYCPNVDKLIAIRHNYKGSKDPMDDSTTYVAPSNGIVMQSYKPIRYSYLLSSGTPEQVRDVFTENKDFTDNLSLGEDRYDIRVSPYKFDMTDLDFADGKTFEIFCGMSSTTVSYDENEKAAKLCSTVGYDPYATIDFSANSDRIISADNYNCIEIEYMIPETNQMEDYIMMLFLCAGSVKGYNEKYTSQVSLIKDGEYHTATFVLSDLVWSGEIHKIRFDFFHRSGAGDEIFVKSFRLTNVPEMGLDTDFTKKENEVLLMRPHSSEVTYDEEEKAVKITATKSSGDVSVELNFENVGANAEEYTAIEFEYMIPESNSSDTVTSALYFCAGEDTGFSGSRHISGNFVADGKYHTMRFELGNREGWSGVIKKIRFDYFEGNNNVGDAVYIKRITLISPPGFEIDVSAEGSANSFASKKYTEVYFDENEEALALKVSGGSDVGVVMDLSGEELYSTDYTRLIIRYMIPTTNSREKYSCCLYFDTDTQPGFSEQRAIYGKLIADGNYHTIVISLFSNRNWNGMIRNLRFDYFQDKSSDGDLLYIKSIALK